MICRSVIHGNATARARSSSSSPLKLGVCKEPCMWSLFFSQLFCIDLSTIRSHSWPGVSSGPILTRRTVFSKWYAHILLCFGHTMKNCRLVFIMKDGLLRKKPGVFILISHNARICVESRITRLYKTGDNAPGKREGIWSRSGGSTMGSSASPGFRLCTPRILTDWGKSFADTPFFNKK